MPAKYRKGQSGGKRKPSANFLAASAKWRSHLADYRVKNPGQSLKRQMQGAKKTYKRIKSDGVNSKYNVVKRKVSKKPKKARKTKRKTKMKNSKKIFGIF